MSIELILNAVLCVCFLCALRCELFMSEMRIYRLFLLSTLLRWLNLNRNVRTLSKFLKCFQVIFHGKVMKKMSWKGVLPVPNNLSICFRLGQDMYNSILPCKMYNYCHILAVFFVWCGSYTSITIWKKLHLNNSFFLIGIVWG